MTTSIVSAAGHADTLAGHISSGIEQSDASTWLIDLLDGPSDLAHLSDAPKIIFGSSTNMGGVSARFTSFVDDARNVWEQQPWHNKSAAGFTESGNRSCDKTASLQHLATFAAQNGMIWDGCDLIAPGAQYDTPSGIKADSVWLDLMAPQSNEPETPIPDGEAEIAIRFGTRIAQAAARCAMRMRRK